VIEAQPHEVSQTVARRTSGSITIHPLATHCTGSTPMPPGLREKPGARSRTLRELDDDRLRRLVYDRNVSVKLRPRTRFALTTEVSSASPYRFYSARCNGALRTTSVLTKAQWLNLGLVLGQAGTSGRWIPRTLPSGANPALTMPHVILQLHALLKRSRLRPVLLTPLFTG